MLITTTKNPALHNKLIHTGYWTAGEEWIISQTEKCSSPNAPSNSGSVLEGNHDPNGSHKRSKEYRRATARNPQTSAFLGSPDSSITLSPILACGGNPD